MYYSILHTAFGYVGIIFTLIPFTVKRIFLPRPEIKELEADIRKEYLANSSLLSIEATGSLDGRAEDVEDFYLLSSSLKSYFQGTPIELKYQWLDMSNMTPLQQLVLDVTSRIPYGEVRSYTWVANLISRPRAQRFVGNTLARNPFPILIPCHRVIRGNGSLGGFAGGLELKRRLIALERKAPRSP